MSVNEPVNSRIHAAQTSAPRRRFLAQAGSAAAALAWHSRAPAATAMPASVRWVLGFAPGGGTDTLARALAPIVGQKLGCSIVVENRPGANGNLAAEMVAKATSDGATMLYNTSSLITSPWLYKSLSYDPLRDFTPVARIANIPLLLVAHPSLPVKTLAEFVAYAKARPGELTYASAGNGNSTHLSNLLFQQAAGISAVHVPYKGGGPALNDTVAGHVQFYMDTANTALGFVKERRLRALAVTSLSRLTALPEVPTVAEAIQPGFETGSWTGLVAPAQTPPDLIARMAQAVIDALHGSEMSGRLASQAAENRALPGEKYAAYLRSESERWGRIIQQHRITLD